MGKVYLFLGIETEHWVLSQFDDVISYCKSHNIDGVLIKVYEVTQGMWYPLLGGPQAVTNYMELSGIDCVPYGYFYGGTNWPKEALAMKQLCDIYTQFCLNLEGEWDNDTNNTIDELVQLLSQSKMVNIWVSTWANPLDHDWGSNIAKLDKYVETWMPECYDDNLTSACLIQFPAVHGTVCPTYKIGSNTIANIIVSDCTSMWEYQLGQQIPSWVDAFVAHQKDKQMKLIVNSFQMLFDMPYEYQIESGESQDLCGNYGVASFRYAGLPNKGARGTGEQVDQLADAIATQWNAGPINEQGSSIADMYNYLTVLDDKGNRALHFQEIEPSQDRIAIALNAGYGLLVTANEQNIRSVKTGQRPPYPWNLNANHIIPLVGLVNGNYVVPDYLNNKFQGEWPCIYDASVLQPSWAVIIQVVGDNPDQPWLAPIPSGEPLTWLKGFNAQLFNQSTTGNQVTSQQQQLIDVWNRSVVGPTPNSQIYKAWLSICATLNLGQPDGKEVSTVDWAGNPIQFQGFGPYHFEWSHIDGKSRLYDNRNTLVGTYGPF